MKSSRIVRAGINLRKSVIFTLYGFVIGTISILVALSTTNAKETILVTQISAILTLICGILALASVFKAANDLINVNNEIIEGQTLQLRLAEEQQQKKEQKLKNDQEKIEIKNALELEKKLKGPPESRSSEISGDKKVRCSKCKVFSYVEKDINVCICNNCNSKITVYSF